jgi:hypothetical protein
MAGMEHELPGHIDIPEDFGVYAIADIHGVYSGLVRVLSRAGLLDEQEHWSAPASTALVVVGDSIDRGTRSLAVLRLLDRLRREARETGGLVAILEGNHEQIARDGLNGRTQYIDMWLRVGGGATLAEIGLDEGSRALHRDVRALRSAVDRLAPDFRPGLYSMAPYARWRDVCFVHGGWPFGMRSMGDFEASPDRLWCRNEFYDGPSLDGPTYRIFAQAGLRQAVVGHTPIGPAFFQDGRVLVLDSNCAASLDMPTFPLMTIAHLSERPGALLSEAQLIEEPTSEAPDRTPEI